MKPCVISIGGLSSLNRNKAYDDTKEQQQEFNIVILLVYLLELLETV